MVCGPGAESVEHADQKLNLGGGGPRVSTASGMGSRLTSLRVVWNRSVRLCSAMPLHRSGPRCLGEFPGPVHVPLRHARGRVPPSAPRVRSRPRCGRALGWRPLDRRRILGATAIGGVAGATAGGDLAARSRPATQLDLSGTANFNFPGIYHGAFLVFACGFFAGAECGTRPAPAVGHTARHFSRSALPVDRRRSGVLALGLDSWGFCSGTIRYRLSRSCSWSVGLCLAIGLAMLRGDRFHRSGLAVTCCRRFRRCRVGRLLPAPAAEPRSSAATLSVLAAAFAGVFGHRRTRRSRSRR